MNIATGNKEDGTPFLILTLGPANMHRMKEGDPALLRVHEFFPEGIPRRLEVLLAFSETPIKQAQQLAEMAEMVFDERGIGGPKRPHCPECRSTIEQLGVQRNESPVAVVYCSVCGCLFGTVASDAVKALAKS
jgi:hypothetical protein